MNGVIKDFFVFLENELSYLEKVSQFLDSVPKLITGNRIDSYEFGNYLEKYELEVYRIASQKKGLLLQLAAYYKIDVTDVSFTYISNSGHKEFLQIGKKIFDISNRIKFTLLKVSIYLAKFTKLNNDLKKVNRFLFQDNYSASGIEKKEYKNSLFSSEA